MWANSLTNNDHPRQLLRARIALEGLSVGDSFGGFFEFRKTPPIQIKTRTLPPSPWHFTDDTNMALSIYDVLKRYGKIDQDALAESFAEHYDRSRGYGMGVRTLIARMKKGESWREVAQSMYKGGGSFGNGGAMRVAPIGAYFAENPIHDVIEQAALSSEITHAHPEGIAGAIAVAVATAVTWQVRDTFPARAEFIDLILPHIPASEVKNGVQRARDLPAACSIGDAVSALGNGSGVSAQTTVPFVLWCSGEHTFEEAIWTTATGAGDTDTTCAMVGGIVAMKSQIPPLWVQHRESLPDWAIA